MKIDFDKAKDIKLAVHALYETEHGKVLIELLEQMGGKYIVDESISSDRMIGRGDMIRTIRTLHRSTEEQIVAYYEEEGI